MADQSPTPTEQDWRSVLREAEARVNLTGVRLADRTRTDTLDVLRPFLRHEDGCGGHPCLCGLTAVVALLEAGTWGIET